jgi:hypothetical protein
MPVEHSNESVSMGFKRGTDGRIIYFPWGLFGRGYLLESDQQYAKLRRRMMLGMVVYGFLATAAWVGYGPAVGMAAAALMCAVSVVGLSRFTRRLEPSDERVSILESWRNQAESSRAATLWIFEIVGVLFILAAVGIFRNAQDWQGWLTGAAAFVFFGFCTAASTYMIIVKRRSR